MVGVRIRFYKGWELDHEFYYSASSWDDFRIDWKYVKLDSKYYEMTFYNADYSGDSDYICTFQEIDGTRVQYGFKDVTSIIRNKNPGKLCECGAEKLNLAGHSYWCPKWEKNPYS